MTRTGVTTSGIEIAKEIYALGIRLLQLDKMHEAAFQFNKALHIAPDFVDASLAQGYCLHELRQYEKALSVYDHLLSASPHLAAAWNNRGTTLLEMGRFTEAASSFSRALEIAPALHDARVAVATCQQALGRNDEALSACEEVLAIDPEHAEAHWNRSLLLLLKGDYHEGWQEYEWRWKKRNFTSPRRDFTQPRWQGEPVADRTILIHAEQGFGDTLQFCRYVSFVAARGARVIFECRPPLAPLMESLAENVRVVSTGRPLPPFDLHVPLLSLPLIFGTSVETIPGAVPYLAPPADHLPSWCGSLTEERSLKVGVCWAGNAYPDPRRSCPVELLAPLGQIEHVSLFSLQVGWKEVLPLPMKDFTAHICNFGDTAALISMLDLVITVDTAVAHLSGALGKPTWVMLPHAPDWRWMTGRNDTPWYPSMRLFRQVRAGEWQDVVQRVAHSLEIETSQFSSPIDGQNTATGT
jgi:Tfp pilus assembly protein PilF